MHPTEVKNRRAKAIRIVTAAIVATYETDASLSAALKTSKELEGASEETDKVVDDLLAFYIDLSKRMKAVTTAKIDGRRSEGLTPASAALLARLRAEDDYLDGCGSNEIQIYMLAGDFTAAERGNLTDLKAKGFVSEAIPDDMRPGAAWYHVKTSGAA